jgi:hypothetical protein
LQLIKKPVQPGRAYPIAYVGMFCGTVPIQNILKKTPQSLKVPSYLTVKKIIDSRLSNKITKQEVTLRVAVPAVLKALIFKIFRPH